MRLPTEICKAIKLFREELKERQIKHPNWFAEVEPWQFPWYYDFINNCRVCNGGMQFGDEFNIKVARQLNFSEEIFDYLAHVSSNINKGPQAEENPWDNCIFFFMNYLFDSWFCVAWYAQEDLKGVKMEWIPEPLNQEEVDTIKKWWAYRNKVVYKIEGNDGNQDTQ